MYNLPLRVSVGVNAGKEKKRAQIKRSSGVAWSHELRAAIVAKTFPLPKKKGIQIVVDYCHRNFLAETY